VKRKETTGGATAEDAAPGAGQTFEQALARLEGIVERLEGGEETLEASLRLYEEAVGLWRFCEQQMRVAQERIAQLGAEAAPGEAEEPRQE
jgi:exodeoxyribonuclease VII small subunit